MADRTPAKIKASAIADLAEGQQPAVVADRYGLNYNTVRSWKNRMDATLIASVARSASIPASLQRPAMLAQQLAIGDLVLENLRAKLIATQRIAEHASITTWLDKQTAADVAELFETLDRSAVAILDRMASARRPDDDGDESA